MRGDYDEQLVILGSQGIADHGSIEPGNGAQARDAAHRARIAAGDFSGHNGRLAILQANAALVFAVGDYGYSVRAVPGERADLQFQLQADFRVAVDHGCCLEIQSQIFIADRWERRNIALVPQHLGNLRRIVNGSVGSVEDGVTFADVESGFFALSGAKSDAA